MELVIDPLWAPDGYPISEPRLIKLLNSNLIKRLNYIGQAGPLNHLPSPNGYISDITRKSHSIGCMILTLKSGGSPDEAIAALIHDIMHTAFSHIFDYIDGDMGYSYHEKYKDKLLKPFESELSEILGISWKNYFQDGAWPLIKNNRIFATDIADYIIRDALAFGIIGRTKSNLITARNMADQLIIGPNRQLTCKSESAASYWRQTANFMHTQVYGSGWNVAMNHYFTKGIQECVKNKIINLQDLIEVTNPQIERQTTDSVLKTKNGQLLSDMGNKNWYLIGEFEPLKYGMVEVGLFDIRCRIINPPIINQEISLTEARTEKKKLVYILV